MFFHCSQAYCGLRLVCIDVVIRPHGSIVFIALPALTDGSTLYMYAYKQIKKIIHIDVNLSMCSETAGGK